MRNRLKNLFTREYLILFIILLVGAFLRLPTVLTNSFAYTYDVGRDMLALANILTTHKPLLIGFTTGLPGVFYGPWWYYLLLPFFFLFGGNPQGIDFVMVIIGILSIILGYFLGKKIGDTFLGIAIASLIAVSTDFIFLSTQIWNPNIAPVFVILVLLIIYRIYIKKAGLSDFLGLGLILALIIDLEIVFGMLLFIGIVLSLIATVKQRFALKPILSFLIGLLIVFSPRIIFELRHQFIMTNSFIKFFLVGEPTKNLDLLNTIIDRLNIFFGQFSATLTSGNKLVGMVLILYIVFSILLFYKNASQIYKNYLKASLIVLLTFLLGTVLFKHDIWPHYLVGLPVFYVLLFSLSLGLIVEKTKNYILPSLIVLIIFLFNLNLGGIISNFNKPMWIGDASVYRNQLEVIDYVYKSAQRKDFKYVVYTPPVHDYTYRYLFDWYGPKKYNYSSNENARLAFFILEPDIQYSFRLTDWLKQRESDGKIIKTEKFKSGIIVQTRVH